MSDSTLTPPPPAPQAAPTPGPVATGRSPLPIIAISLAGLALLLAFAAAGVAWLPALAAIVLAIIALVKKAQPRILAVLAIIIAPAAWLIAIVVFIVGASAAFRDGFEAGLQQDDRPVVQESAAEQEPEAAPEPPAADGRSLDSALPFGSVVAVDSWAGSYDVSFGAINWDATDAIKAENMFNSDPAEGMKYIMVAVTMTNTDDEEWNASGTFFWGDIKLVSNGRGFSEGALVVAPGGLSDQGELYPGGTATGNVVFEVPLEVTSGTWDVAGTFVSAQ